MGRTRPLATGADAAKSFCYSLLPPLGTLGHCTVTSASAQPVMTENVFITIGYLLLTEMMEL